MDAQNPDQTLASPHLVTAEDLLRLAGAPPVTGAWRSGDPVAGRRFVSVDVALESGVTLKDARIAYETWGTLSAEADNAILILHALTGDAHVSGPSGPGQPTAGWWSDLVGPGRAVDTGRWFVVCANVLGGCQGSTGPSSQRPNGQEWGPDFPVLTIRDQVAAQALLADRLGIRRWHAVIGGSMGGMHALEWAVSWPDRVERCAVLAAPAATPADQIALNHVQHEAIVTDPAFRGGRYYDSPDGPHHGLALARRIALLSYRSAAELEGRFGRAAQSTVSPLFGSGRFSVESYLDFHGNKFTRRFDANSYLCLMRAMNSHDVGRGRGGIATALERITARTLVVGITTDRLSPVDAQREISAHVRTSVTGSEPHVVDSIHGHDAFLIETHDIGPLIEELLVHS